MTLLPGPAARYAREVRDLQLARWPRQPMAGAAERPSVNRARMRRARSPKSPVVPMIADIARLLNQAASRGESIGLHELLWTIDARHHAIPTPDEIATARMNAPPFRVVRSDSGITLVPGSACSDHELTQHDIAVAMNI